MRQEGGRTGEVKQGAGGTQGEREEGEQELGVGKVGGWRCLSRGPPCELCSREPGRWGEVVRACLKQYTQGFSQSSHTQCARSMSLSQRWPAQLQQIRRKSECAGTDPCETITPTCSVRTALTCRGSKPFCTSLHRRIHTYHVHVYTNTFI